MTYYELQYQLLLNIVTLYITRKESIDAKIE